MQLKISGAKSVDFGPRLALKTKLQMERSNLKLILGKLEVTAMMFFIGHVADIGLQHVFICKLKSISCGWGLKSSMTSSG